MKQKNINQVLVVVLATVLAVTAVACYQAYKYLKKNGTQSCLYGIAAEVEQARLENRLEFNGTTRELTKAEIEKLFAGRNIDDCGNVLARSENIHIAIGNVNQSPNIKTVVWTNGDDAIQGTADDIVAPYDGKVP